MQLKKILNSKKELFSVISNELKELKKNLQHQEKPK